MTDDSRLTSDDSPATSPPRHPATRQIDPGETLLALAVIIFGLLVVWQTTQIRLTPAYSKVGPRVIPYIVGGGLVVIGVWLGVEALTGRSAAPSTESEDADPALPTDWRTVGLLALALLAYLLLLERAGFVIASAVLFVAAAYAMGSRRFGRDIVTGVVMATVLYVGFTRGLDLQLPAGVLAGLL
jgi:putative tricarboxylic transport membrane protein